MTSPGDLLFDLDGTLTDNYAGIAASIRHALARLDAPAPDDAELRQYVGPPLRATFATLLATDEREVVERAIAHYRERFADIGWRENTAYPGIEEALGRLRAAGARLFVCTAKPQIYAERIVAHFGFDAHFDAVYGADLDGHYDDKAKLMAHVVAREGLTTARVVMIGDRDHDLRAARANGIRAVGVLWGYGSAEELALADAIVATPAELPGVLLGLTAQSSA
ncbi:MAG TPA: HAD hydrolase-like protein [Casimicrobiaceae bacterium]|nr:HAD hydrolase-like protein [Casimicrobiaceae bacterium]